MKPVLMVLLVSLTSAYARIGETEEQIVARYGPATEIMGNGMRRYNPEGLNLVVHYDHGKAQAEVFQKKDLSPLAPADVQTFLRNNSEGHEWIDDRTIPIRGIRWNLSGSNLTADFDAEHRAMSFYTSTPPKLERDKPFLLAQNQQSTPARLTPTSEPVRRPTPRPTPRVGNISNPEAEKLPFVGMTKTQALARYGKPKRNTVTEEGEQWVYILNMGEVIGKAFIPFNFKPTIPRTGVLTFGPDGTVKKFTWDTNQHD